MSIAPLSGRPFVPLPDANLAPLFGAAKTAGGVLTSPGALLPDAPGLSIVGGLAQPLLAGALGVDQDKLGGMSPLSVLAELVSRTKTLQAEGRRDVINAASGASSKASLGVQSAADNYDADIGDALGRWASKPENLERGFKFAGQVVMAAGAAIASGGASLAKDLPALGAQGLAIADDILKETGSSLQQVLGDLAADALTELGVEPETAKQLGPFLASAGIAATQAYAAYSTGDFSKLDPAVFGDAVRHGSALLGASDGTAATLGTLTSGGLSLGVAIAGGDSQLLKSGNLDKLLTSGSGVADQLQRMVGGNGFDPDALKGFLGIFADSFPAVLGDLEKDTGIPNIRSAVDAKISGFFEDLGPFKDVAKMGLDLLLQGMGSQQRNMI